MLKRILFKKIGSFRTDIRIYQVMVLGGGLFIFLKSIQKLSEIDPSPFEWFVGIQLSLILLMLTSIIGIWLPRLAWDEKRILEKPDSPRR